MVFYCKTKYNNYQCFKCCHKKRPFADVRLLLIYIVMRTVFFIKSNFLLQEITNNYLYSSTEDVLCHIIYLIWTVLMK